MATQDHHYFSILVDGGMNTTTTSTSTTVDQQKKKKKTKKKGNPSALQPSRKPFDGQGVVKKNVEPITVAEDDEYPFYEGFFLHDHTRCIKDWDYYLLKLDEDNPPVELEVDVVEPDVLHVEVIMDDIEDNPRWLTEEEEEEEEIDGIDHWLPSEIDCAYQLKPMDD